ncbi:MAG: response regulator [Desulfobacteraceae bacterium]|nr:response regulator [Desulfobacteraceae bacterium]
MKNVLIADDDPVFLRLLVNSLKEYQHEFKVLTAKDGKEAMFVLSNEPISLLITDIIMPEVDGLELLAYVSENHSATSCYAMTAYGTPEIKKQIPRDILKFLNKPFPMDEIGPEILKTLKKDTPSGLIFGISVTSFLLMLELEKKTCLFEVTFPNETKGLVYFKKGVIQNAVYEGLKGEEAIIAIIVQGKGKFRFKTLTEIKIPMLITKDLTQLITEAKSQSLNNSINNEENDTPDNDGPENKLNLSGIFHKIDDGQRGKIIVMNISRIGIQFKLEVPHSFHKDAKLILEFTLDDKLKSEVSKEVVVQSETDLCINAEFSIKNHYDKLGPYLLFNNLSNQKLF